MHLLIDHPLPHHLHRVPSHLRSHPNHAHHLVPTHRLSRPTLMWRPTGIHTPRPRPPHQHRHRGRNRLWWRWRPSTWLAAWLWVVLLWWVKRVRILLRLLLLWMLLWLLLVHWTLPCAFPFWRGAFVSRQCFVLYQKTQISLKREGWRERTEGKDGYALPLLQETY